MSEFSAPVISNMATSIWRGDKPVISHSRSSIASHCLTVPLP